MTIRIKIFDSSNKSLDEDGQATFVVRAGKKVKKVVFGVNKRKVAGKDKAVTYSGMDQLRASQRQIIGAKKRKVKMNMILRKRKKSLRIRDKLNVQTRSTAGRMMSLQRKMRAKVKRN